jgi:hypothetical protein
MVAAMVPLVSILIPCGARHVEHVRTAAASAAWQSLAPLCETIIVCDGGAVVAPLPGCTVLPGDGERHGPAHARNRALAAARGQFILPLDADDYLLAHAVEYLLREYSAGSHGYVYGDCYTQERDGNFILRSAPDYTQQTYSANGQKYGGMDAYNLHVVTALIPTHHARAVGGYDEGVDAWEDWSFHLRLAMAGVCGYRLPLPIFTYRVHLGDRMTRFYGGAPELMEKVLVRYRDDTGGIPMAGCCGGDANLAAMAGDALNDAPLPPAAPMGDGKVRVQYVGDERGTQTFEYPNAHHPIRLGNNTMARYADVTLDQAEWLKAHGIPVRVVPLFDAPQAPTPLPVAETVLLPTQSAVALRPRGRKVEA